ncbi:hypothetical protein V7S43_001059 [Phytophthora oleae]|uniref:Cardiolipin synthase N-terminal domain-containing protein n=1 Tax=Phytophthora oleae TaxID=2107226 RepID=A0ABD3G2X3_9STRA
MKLFTLLSLEVAAVHAKPSSSISSLEELWIFIAVVYAAVLVPLLGYFLYAIARDPTTRQVMETMWVRLKQQTLAFLGPRQRSAAITHERESLLAKEGKKNR